MFIVLHTDCRIVNVTNGTLTPALLVDGATTDSLHSIDNHSIDNAANLNN
jgi:hypothetical protein